MSFTAALDIGGTTLAAGLVGRDGRVHHRVETPAPRAAAEVVDAAKDLLAQIIGSDQVDAIGIGSPGTIHPIEGVVVASDSKPEYRGARIGPELGERFGLPYAVTNDVNAAAVGELAHGVAAGFARVLLVSVGTGVGGALLINGRIEEGSHGTTGEIAHLLVGARGERPCGCGAPDHLEAVASGPAMAARSAARGGPATMPAIAAAAAAGDRVADEVLDEGARWLGRAVAGFANAVDIEALVLTGGVVQIGAAYTDRVAAAFSAEVMRPLHGVPVLLGALGADAPLVGAATYVRARLGLG